MEEESARLQQSTPHPSISPLLAASIRINCISERAGESASSENAYPTTTTTTTTTTTLPSPAQTHTHAPNLMLPQIRVMLCSPITSRTSTIHAAAPGSCYTCCHQYRVKANITTSSTQKTGNNRFQEAMLPIRLFVMTLACLVGAGLI
ncbi:uncharacterized [Tachysurus ichikawai]